ncbi:unnamed protein product [Rotaria sp. Silwood1]|nr:unnamed protein product [Rotaria sp. Silwood1]
MLYTCSYNSQHCSAADFISFTTSAYGLCYTFNAKLKKDSVNSIRYGNENGGDGRLELGLYVHSNQYVPYFVDGIGISSYQQCGRVNPYIWEIVSIILPGTNNIIIAPLCDLTDNCTNQTADTYLATPSDENDPDSYCPQECSITDFLFKKSSLLTPLEW